MGPARPNRLWYMHLKFSFLSCFKKMIFYFFIYCNLLFASPPGREFRRCIEENGGMYIMHIFFLINFVFLKESIGCESGSSSLFFFISTLLMYNFLFIYTLCSDMFADKAQYSHIANDIFAHTLEQI